MAIAVTTRGVDKVRIADLVVPAKIEVTAVDMEDGPDTVVRVEPRNGRLVATEVTVRFADGRPVTSEHLRAVRVANLTTHAAGEVMKVTTNADGSTRLSRAALTEADLAYVRENGLTDRTLKIVAMAYRLAMITSQPPTKAVEDWLALPRSTAGRWVAAARKAGYLGKAEGPGKAGVGRNG